jgi:hypothetical protein
VLMVNGPTTRVRVRDTSSGLEHEYGPADRAKALAQLQAYVDQFVSEGPLWPGFGERPNP